jgi:hypothetical protein
MKQLLRSFASGEITPELAGRLDLTKFQTGLSLCRNFITLPHGPAARRPGTEYINEVFDSSAAVRLIPFTFSADQTAVLEFGNEYIRVYINGGALLEADKTITGISDDTVSVTAHGYSAGDWVFIGGRFFIVDTVATDSFTVTTLNGEAGAPAGEIASRVFTLASTYQAEDLFDLHYAQSADVVTITHPDYPTAELARLSATSWTLTTVSFAPSSAAPTGVTATPTVAQNSNLTAQKYVVTAVQPDGVTESLASAVATATNNLGLAGNLNTISWTGVSGCERYNVYKLRGGIYGYIGQVTPVPGSTKTIATMVQGSTGVESTTVTVTTTASHGFSTGNGVYIQGAEFSWLEGYFVIAVTSATTFIFTARRSKVATSAGGTVSIPTLSLVDDNVTADTTSSPPEDIIELNKAAGDYPSATVYHEQRRWFAGTGDAPQVLWATRTGTDKNLTSSIPTREADALEVRVASSQYNQIRHLVALSDLIALTAGGEFRIYADGAPAITPTSISIKPQGYSGASNVQPVLTSGSLMYVQAQGSRIRELSYSWEANSYKTVDTSLMAPHRFDYYTVVDMAFSRSPDPILWAVRNDGLLLGLTYVPEQQVYGWHAHDTEGGRFESVCVVPEGGEDILYAVVKRTINDRDVRYIERFSTRYFLYPEFCYFVDCGSTYQDKRALVETALQVDVLTIDPSEAYYEVPVTAQEIYFDTEISRSAYHYRKVGSQVWLFQDEFVEELWGPDIFFKPAVIWRLDASYSVVDRTVVQDINTAFVSRENGYSLTETSTHFYLWGVSGNPYTPESCVVKISKSDPTDQTTIFTNEGGKLIACPTSDNTGAWLAYSAGVFPAPAVFKRWVYATESFSFADTRTGPSTNWILGMFSILHLTNDDLVYSYGAIVVFLHPNGLYDELDTGGLSISALKSIGNANEIWALTGDTLLRIDTSVPAVLNTYPVDGCTRTQFNQGQRATDMVYASEQGLLCWLSQDSTDEAVFWGFPYFVTFNVAVGAQVAKVPYPIGRDDVDYTFEYIYGLGYIDGGVWASAVRIAETEPEYIVGNALYKINPADPSGQLVVTWTDSSPAVGAQFLFFDAASSARYDFTVLETVSPTRSLVLAARTLPESLYGVPVTEWYVKVDTVSGLDHLEGQEVDILADGVAHRRVVVENGTITLDEPAAIVTIGLPITADLRTLPLTIEGAQASGQGTMKNVNKVHMRVFQSAPAKAGPAFDRLREVSVRAGPEGSLAIVRDGEFSVTVDPSWNTDAAVCVRQDLPLPLTVLSMTLEVATGG